MQSILKTALCLAALCLPGVLVADVVTLKNGDRVTGKVISSDAEKLKVATEFMGEIEIQWDAVSDVVSEDKLYLSSKDGQVLVGPVTTAGEEFQVETTQSGEVAVPKAEIVAVRNEEAQEAYVAEIERLRNPGLLDFWSGFYDMGFSFTGGNAETTAFTNSARAQRATERDKITTYMTSVFAQNSTSGEKVTTANAIRGGTRYDINVSEKLFTFGFLDLEFDEFQDLDLRSVLGGGMGYHLRNTDKWTWDFFGGASYNQEFFKNDLTRRSAELVMGEEMNYLFTKSTAWSHRIALYPNMSETGEFRLQFDTSLTSQLYQWLGWHVTVSDRFLSNPVPGREKNDVLLTTGVRVSFGKE